MKVSAKFALAAVTFAAVPFFMAASLFAQDEDPPARAARVAYMKGTVSLQPAGSDSWNDLPPNYPMISGDRIYTDQSARAIIQNGSSDVRLWGGTDVTLTNLTDQYEQVALAQGSIRVRVFRLNSGNTVEVDTPNAAVFIQQPGDYRINAYDQQASLVAVNVGSVQITGQGINQEVDQGQAVQITGTNQVEVGLVEMPAFDDLDRWSIDRDHHIMNSASARYVSREVPGYDDLDDYGQWSNTPDYGPVWYPNSMPAGWQPYSMGHWAYVNPWGYTWVDDEPWGYAPFHYGRWSMIGGRWGWAPGPVNVVPVYSPALVAFVGSPGGVSIGIGVGSVAAWFPLGIGEPYVPWYHCTPNYVRTVNVTNVNTTVIHNTTIINNYNTFITNTHNVTNVNQINVTNVNYVNRQHVYAVQAQDLTRGVHVQQAAVRLNEQQRQQLVKAPVVVARPVAPPPQKPLLLQARTNVPRPVARPVVMTPHGPAPATPAPNRAVVRPVSLTKPQPATAIKPAMNPVAPNLKPAAPVAAHAAPMPTQPGRPAPPANNTRPVTPTANNPLPTPPNETRPMPPVNEARPGTPPTARPVTPENRPAPVTQPNRPIPPANETRPTPPANNTRSIPPNETRPVPPTNNTRPAFPMNETRPTPPTNVHPQPMPENRPAPVTRPAPPDNETRPAPPANTRPMTPYEARPTPPPANAHPMPENHPAPTMQPNRPAPPNETRPAPPPQYHPQPQPRPEAQPQARPAPQPQPQMHPAPQPQAHPAPQPQTKTPPKDEPRPQ